MASSRLCDFFYLVSTIIICFSVETEPPVSPKIPGSPNHISKMLNSADQPLQQLTDESLPGDLVLQAFSLRLRTGLRLT